MSVGTLHALTILNDPGKIHRGNRDPVLGHINLRFSPGAKNPGAELFGPLQVFVILHGRAKSKIWKSNGQSTSIYRGRAPLFARRVLIYDDSFRARSGEEAMFPFSVSFPETVDALPVDDFNDDGRFICQQNQPLPPSFQSSYHGFAHRYESFVEYRVGVDVVMPRLQVAVDKPTRYMEPIVQYQRPGGAALAALRPTEWRGVVSVKNELLLPEPDRPSGFRGKTKALFGGGHFPTYAFDWVCLAPKDLYLGQPACFEVRISPRTQECTAPLVPEVHLKFFRLEIKALTQVRADRTIFRCPESEGNYTICQMTGSMDDSGPFSKANENTKTINTAALGGNNTGSFTPSFATYNISQSYTAKISFAFELTEKSKTYDREYAILVHPPLIGTPLTAAVVAGSSSKPGNTEDTNADLPRYDPLPSYEEASTSKT